MVIFNSYVKLPEGIVSRGECKRELGCEHHSSASLHSTWWPVSKGRHTHTQKKMTPKWKLHRSNYVGKNDYQWLPTTRIYGKRKTQEWSWKWLGLKFLDLTTLWGSGFRLVRPLDVGNQSKTIGPPRGRRTLESRSLCGALALFRGLIQPSPDPGQSSWLSTSESGIFQKIYLPCKKGKLEDSGRFCEWPQSSKRTTFVSVPNISELYM